MIKQDDQPQQSGWTFLLTASFIVTVDQTNAMLSASSNIILCRYLHLVTACRLLYIMQKQAYESYIPKHVTMEEQIPDEESPVLNQKSQMFKFWNTTFEMESTLLEFVKAILTGNFMLYVKILIHIAP